MVEFCAGLEWRLSWPRELVQYLSAQVKRYSIVVTYRLVVSRFHIHGVYSRQEFDNSFERTGLRAPLQYIAEAK